MQICFSDPFVSLNYTLSISASEPNFQLIFNALSAHVSSMPAAMQLNIGLCTCVLPVKDYYFWDAITP